MNRLNITKKEFQSYMDLKEFNTKYDTNIDDIEIEELDLSQIKLGNEGLKFLGKIFFKGLNTLNLNDTEISDINILSSFNLPDLVELDLSDNKISDINILQKVNFNKLEVLYLNDNKISDINILKYSTRIKNRLNINKEDFEIYINLKEINNKYNTNIADIYI